jgi:UMP-CMP kinase
MHADATPAVAVALLVGAGGWWWLRKERSRSPAKGKPKVLFVLGGPGAGKGTQCTKVVENFPKWAHISAGDCLRAERKNPESKDGALINSLIKEGKIVPTAITVKLLMNAIDAETKKGKTCFLIDGYPRSIENVNGWTENVGDKAAVMGVLFYEAAEEELQKRLLGRGEGRDDDQVDVIKKRFATYLKDTMPIVDKYRKDGQVIAIDGMKPIDEVWKVTEQAIRDVEAKPIS